MENWSGRKRNPKDIWSEEENWEEGLYSNYSCAVNLLNCRTNTLKLNWRQRFQGGIVVCPVCDSDAMETLNHFLKEWQGLSGIRERLEASEEDKIKELLLFWDLDKRKKYMEDLWRESLRRVWRGDAEQRGDKKEEYASPSAGTKARLGIPSDAQIWMLCGCFV